MSVATSHGEGRLLVAFDRCTRKDLYCSTYLKSVLERDIIATNSIYRYTKLSRRIRIKNEQHSNAEETYTQWLRNKMADEVK